MKRFAARLLAYGAAAIPCAVFLAIQGQGGTASPAPADLAADAVTVVTAGFDPAAAPALPARR